MPLLDELLEAADRGVRVRVLVDDVLTKGQDRVFATMDAHPNIQIRVFNPFVNRRLRSLNFLTDFNRVNRRMHNKVFIADNQVAVVGGRNIGDEYFAVREDFNFGDLDAVALVSVHREGDVRDADARIGRQVRGDRRDRVAELVGQENRAHQHHGDDARDQPKHQEGRQFDIDLAIINLGAYEPRWFMAPSHMNPDATVRAFREIGARKLMIAPWGSFQLGDEPIHFPPDDLKKALVPNGLLSRWIPLGIGESYFF